MAQDGLARAHLPGAHRARRRHGVRGGDRSKPLARSGAQQLTELGAIAANVLARAIARGVYEARALPFPGALPSWSDKFG